MSTAWGQQPYVPVGPRDQPPSCLHPVLSHPQHILYCIVDSECKSRDVLQSYFDLLGELMKFNVDAFKRFNKYINTDAKVSLLHGSVRFATSSRSYVAAQSSGAGFKLESPGESAGSCQQTFISPCCVPGTVLDPGYTGMKVSAACGQVGLEMGLMQCAGCRDEPQKGRTGPGVLGSQDVCGRNPAQTS